MSQRKKDYTTEEMIHELIKMDTQVIHGSDFFKQCAESLSNYHNSLKQCANALDKCDWCLSATRQTSKEAFDSSGRMLAGRVHDEVVKPAIADPLVAEILKSK
jgi:hypothetical protein